MFLDLLLLPVTGPIGGLIWIGEKIQERADIDEIREEELLLKIQALEEEAAENEAESSL